MAEPPQAPRAPQPPASNLANWNWANILTVSRFFLAPLAFWLVLRAESDKGASWWLVIVAVAVVASDWWDGWFARKHQNESKFGAFLDPFADKVIVLGVAACFVAVGRYWWLPVALLWVRDVGISVLRVVYAKRGVSVPARLSAKWKTTLQGAALTAAALPPLKTYDELHVVLIWAAVAITLYTGLQYLKDGWPTGETAEADEGETEIGETEIGETEPGEARRAEAEKREIETGEAKRVEARKAAETAKPSETITTEPETGETQWQQT